MHKPELLSIAHCQRNLIRREKRLSASGRIGNNHRLECAIEQVQTLTVEIGVSAVKPCRR
jgi:hypothetical protein